MNDMELAEEIERQTKDRDAADIVLELDQWQQIIAALRRWPEPSVPEGESIWLIEQTSTVDGKRRFWNGAGYGWDALKAARYPTREAAVEVARNGFNSNVQDVHGRPEICEHMFQCGPLPERPPSGEMVMVPREPTKEMIEAGTSAVEGGIDSSQDSYERYDVYDTCDLANRAYRAMLSAAEAEGRKG